MTVAVHLKSQSQPIVRIEVNNAYVKDGFYCLYLSNDKVEKYPVQDIFRVQEDYS